jgi:hypothetical protein
MPEARWEAWKVGHNLPRPVGASTTFVVAQDHHGQYKGYLLCISQVVAELGDHIPMSKSTFLRRLEGIAGKKKVLTTTDTCLIKQLKALGAIKAGATHVKMASIPTIKASLMRVDGMKEVASAIGELANMVQATLGPHPTGDPASQVEDELMVDIQEGGTSSKNLYYTYDVPFPVGLYTSYKLDAAAKKEHISIFSLCQGKLPSIMPYKNELKAYKEFCTKPIMLLRPRDINDVKEDTFKCHQKTLDQFMGWAYKFEGISMDKLSLYLATNQGLWTKFISYKVARSTSGQAITQACSHGVRVITYISKTDPSVASDERKQQHLDKMSAFILTLASQVSTPLQGLCNADVLKHIKVWGSCPLICSPVMPR